MMYSLVCFSLLSLSSPSSLSTLQGEEISFSEIQLSHGILGPKRTSSQYLPGDAVVVSFVVDGVSTNSEGKIAYRTVVELMDKSGTVIFTQSGKDSESVNALGGDKFPVFAQVDLGLNQKPGEYTLKISFMDRTSKKVKALSQKFEVLPKSFAMVRFSLSADQEGLAPVAMMGVGQSIWIHGAVVGFNRSATAKQPNVELVLQIMDENGKPTAAKPMSGTIDKGVPATENTLPFQFFLPLTRAGKYTVEVKATDKLTQKSYTQTFPVTVFAAK